MNFYQKIVLVGWLVLVCVINDASSKIFILFNEEFEDCSDRGYAKYIDYSGLSYEYVNDTTYFLNGEI